MKARLVLATAIGFALFQTVKAQETVDFVMNSRSEFRGRHFEYSLTNDDFKDTPAWDPAKGEPPLSVSQASAKARDNMSYFVTDKNGWEPTSIRLTSTSRGKWYYFVTFGCMKPTCADPPTAGFNILVKMDGAVVLPKPVSAGGKGKRPRLEE